MNGTYQPTSNNNNTEQDRKTGSTTGNDRPRHVKFDNQHLSPSDNTESSVTDELISICFEHTDASNSNNVTFFTCSLCLEFIFQIH